MTGPDGHVDDRNLVLDLADADAKLLAVTGKPFQDVRRGAHRIRAVELAAGECRAHGHQLVARHQSPLLACFLELLGERLEMGGRVVVAGLCRFHVHLDDLRFLGKRGLEHRLQAREIQPHQTNHGPDGHRVLHDRQLLVGGGQLGHWQWTELHAFGGLVPRFELGGVVKRQAARLQLLQMAVQGVLVQRDERIHLIAMVQRLLGRDAQAQPGMAATNHGLIAVVREHRLALAGHRHRQGVASRSDTVACRAADADDHVRLVHDNDPFRYGSVAQEIR